MPTKADVAKTKANRKNKVLHTLDVTLPNPPSERWDELPALELLVFDQRNRLVGRTPIREAHVQLEADFGNARMLRGVVAPKGIHSQAAAHSHTLPSVTVSLDKVELESVMLDPGWWEDLIFGKLIGFHGRVEKVFDEHTLPIREGTVEVYEVDPWVWIIKQPELELERFRDDLLHLLDPDPLPELVQPWPWPRPDPPPFEKLGLPMAATPFVMATPVELAAQAAKPMAPHVPAPVNLQTKLLAKLQGEPLRAYLGLNKEFLVSVLPLLLPVWWYHKDKLCEVPIQPDGTFAGSAGWWHPGLDRPDLYFRVRQVIEGVDKVIYSPSVAYHTWWNYAGLEVVLRVTDPEAVAVEDALVAEDDQVVFLGVGFDTTTDVAAASGLVQTGTDLGLFRFPTGKLGPYGHRLHIALDVDLYGLQAAGVAYYRLSYQRGQHTTVGSPNDWTPLTTPVSRHFREVTMVGGTPVVSYPVISLVPTPASLPLALSGVEGVFEFADPVRDYVVIDRADRAFGIWDTETLPGEGQSAGDVADVYCVRLEVFDTSGNDVTSTTPILRIHNKEADDSYSTTALSSAAPFLHLHVDNRAMVAEIRDQILAGTTSTGAGCGFLVGASSTDVDVGLRAFHPDGAAVPGDPDRYIDSWRYRVTRGSNADVRTDVTVTDKNVGSPTVWHDVPSLPDVPVQTIDHLLNGVVLAGPQRRCTFNVRLDVRTLTRNGYGRLHNLDRFDNASFALIERN
jgi:hypothetical protein